MAPFSFFVIAADDNTTSGTGIIIETESPLFSQIIVSEAGNILLNEHGVTNSREYYVRLPPDGSESSFFSTALG